MGQVPPVDWTYNYGTFDFGEGFYLRFLKGELNYRLARSSFASFQGGIHAGRTSNFGATARSRAGRCTLRLWRIWNGTTCLKTAFTPINFFEDNCSSRALKLLNGVFGERWDSGCANDAASGVTYRQAIRPYISGDEWIEAGIDFILGPRSDEVMPPCGSSFLPDGLMAQLPKGRLDGRAIAQEPSELLPPQRPWYRAVSLGAVSSPRFWAWMLLVWSFLWSVRRWMQHRSGAVCTALGAAPWKGGSALCRHLGCALVVDVDVHGSHGYMGQLEFDLGFASAVAACSHQRWIETVAESDPLGAVGCHFDVLVDIINCSAIRIFHQCNVCLVFVVEFGSLESTRRKADAKE